MKNILVPCDFSLEAVHAYRFAVEIASVTGGKVLVLHIIDFSSANENDMSAHTYKDQIALLSLLMEKAEDDFEDLRSNMGIAYDRAGFILEIGTVKETVFKITCEQQIDLVITGASSGKWFEEHRTLSDTEGSVLSIYVPLLTMHHAMHVSDVQELIVVLPDYMELDGDMADKIKVLQNLFHAEIRLVNEIKDRNPQGSIYYMLPNAL